MMPVYYTSLVTAIFFGIGGQIALKSGAEESATIAAHFLNPLTIVGLAIYIAAALSYILALKKIPISIAFPSIAANYAVVACLCIYCGTSLSAGRSWLASVLIGSGMLLNHQH